MAELLDQSQIEWQRVWDGYDEPVPFFEKDGELTLEERKP
jgi:hypothetical protein